MEFGLGYFPTYDGMRPGAVARMAEERGYSAIYFAEHTHIPAAETDRAPGQPLPAKYWRMYDLFVALTAAAGDPHIRVVSGICLVVERDPIITANAVASVDHLSGGRLEFGVGAGWNRTEMRHHGTDPRVRMAIMRERVEAMKEIWTQDEASYHGKYVNFDGSGRGPSRRNGHTRQSWLAAPAQPSSIGYLVRRRLVPQLPPRGVRPHRRAARPRRPARPGAGDERASRSEGVRETPRGWRQAGRAVVPVRAALAPRTSPRGVGEGDRGVQPVVRPHQARRRFAAARVARLATADAAGRPHIVPVTFAVHGDVVYSAVDAKPKRGTALKRFANVAANPAVALLVDHYADDWNELWWVRADGTGRVVDPEDPEGVRALSLLADRYPRFASRGVVLAVDVHRWSGRAASAATEEG